MATQTPVTRGQQYAAIDKALDGLIDGYGPDLVMVRIVARFDAYVRGNLPGFATVLPPDEQAAKLRKAVLASCCRNQRADVVRIARDYHTSRETLVAELERRGIPRRARGRAGSGDNYGFQLGAWIMDTCDDLDLAEDIIRESELHWFKLNKQFVLQRVRARLAPKPPTLEKELTDERREETGVPEAQTGEDPVQRGVA